MYLQASGDSYIAGVRLVERREEGREGGRVEGGTPELPGVCLLRFLADRFMEGTCPLCAYEVSLGLCLRSHDHRTLTVW